MRRLAMILGLMLAGAAGEASAEHLPLDSRVCATAGRDPQADRAATAEVTRQVEAEHKARVQAFKGDEPAFLALQEVYEAARRRALHPLATQGNASAVYGLAQLREVSGAGTNEPERLRLLKCASDLGHPAAQVEQFRVHWHDKGDGSFEAIQRNRALALELAGRAATGGDLGAIGSLGVYIGLGAHQYPVNPDIGRRAFALCAQMGDRFCQARLLEAAEQGRPFALKDPMESYLLAEIAAAAQPGMYARYAVALRAKLTEAELMDAWERLFEWQPATWEALEPEWVDLRRDILANGCEASVTCVLGKACICP